MTITAADLKFFAAEYPLDTTYGGGRRGGYSITTGSENNVFPDVPVLFRSTGGVQFRKVYPSVISANAEALMQAGVIVATGPADAALGVVLFPFGDQSTLSPAAAAALAAFPYPGIGLLETYADVTGQPTQKTFATFNPAPGALVGFYTPHYLTGYATLYSIGVATAVTALSPGYRVTFSISPPVASASTFASALTPSGVKACGIATTTASASAGATSLSVNRVEAQVVPNITPYPATVNGIDPAGLALTGGKVPIFRAGDSVVVSNAAGTVSEVAVVAFVDHRTTNALNFTAGLANAKASGSKVSGMSQIGDLQALVGPSFSQQTWTRAFADALIGNPITANYNRTAGAITTTNLGAMTERWAIIFTSATAFRLVGERIGQIAAGSTASAFAPTNPATSAAYFTIPTAGWGSGWGIGNVLRFNTTGAYALLWAARTVSPTAAAGVDGSTLQLRGSIDA